MTFEEWKNTYKPFPNPFRDNEIMFSLTLMEINFVNEYPDAHIWTLLEGDNGKLIIQSGRWLVNRLGYFLTRTPFETETLTISMEE